jgi:5-methylcytosine-specific restriction endonuclease McrA
MGGARVPAAVRAKVLERDGWVCHWCGGPARSVDHLIPLIAGGPSTEDNLVAACGPCNSKRGARYLKPEGELT